MLGSLDGGAPVQLTLGYSSVAYASGFLLFVRSGTLLAMPFDDAKGRITGDPVSVAERVQYHPGVGTALFSVSTEGTLVVNEEGQRGVGWVDRSGRPLGLVATGILDGVGRLSRDGMRLAAAVTDPGPGAADIYVIDVASGATKRLTTDPKWDQSPVWSPDGRSVIFRSNRELKNPLWMRGIDGGESERRLIVGADGSDLLPTDWSPDGRVVLVERSPPGGSRDLVSLAMPAGDRLEPWLATPFNEREARFSPDSRWVAYQSDESGADEIYIRAFSTPGPSQRVTAKGGTFPVWGRDGRALYFFDADGMMVSVPVTLGAAVTKGAPHILFDARPLGERRNFEVDDAGRFLMNYVNPGPEASRAEIVLNWLQLVQPKK